jgi:xanthine dehydrogenase YagS FAD-binding subunit
LLAGEEPSDELFDRTAQAALADAHPLRHNGYKVQLAKALIVRLLRRLADAT